MKTRLILNNKRIKIAVLSAGLSLLVLLLSGCTTPDKIQAEAEKNFAVFLTRKNSSIPANLAISSIGCSGEDSDGNNYVTCTGQNNSGKEFIYECPYGTFFPENKGCKADKVNTFDYNPSQK